MLAIPVGALCIYAQRRHLYTSQRGGWEARGELIDVCSRQKSGGYPFKRPIWSQSGEHRYSGSAVRLIFCRPCHPSHIVTMVWISTREGAERSERGTQRGQRVCLHDCQPPSLESAGREAPVHESGCSVSTLVYGVARLCVLVTGGSSWLRGILGNVFVLLMVWTLISSSTC